MHNAHWWPHFGSQTSMKTFCIELVHHQSAPFSLLHIIRYYQWHAVSIPLHHAAAWFAVWYVKIITSCLAQWWRCTNLLHGMSEVLSREVVFPSSWLLRLRSGVGLSLELNVQLASNKTVTSGGFKWRLLEAAMFLQMWRRQFAYRTFL